MAIAAITHWAMQAAASEAGLEQDERVAHLRAEAKRSSEARAVRLSPPR